ncbi:MAG: nitronate monooxygenase, partial [Candidatus Omnitrophica bacterium]|nr:nitronate monooxygenase [Candidatus Omnitrophota bacterium]
DKGFAMCGSNAYRIKKIVSVKELIRELVTGAEACLRD